MKADDDDDDEEEAEGEYRVENILAHDFKRGVLLYQIKWLGWDKDEDLTWEPEENLCVALPLPSSKY